MTSVVPERDLARPRATACCSRHLVRPGGRQRHPVAAPARPPAVPAGRRARHDRRRQHPADQLQPARPQLDHRRRHAVPLPGPAAVLLRCRAGPRRLSVVRPRRAAAGPGLDRAAGLHPRLRRPGARGRRRRVPPGRPRQRLLLGPGRDRQLHGPVRAVPVRARRRLPVGTFLLLLGRWAPARSCTGPAAGPPRWSHRVLVVGGREEVDALVAELEREPYAGLKVVGACMPPGDAAEGSSVPVVGSLTSVPRRSPSWASTPSP